MNHDYSKILSALKLQMTQATFNTWLAKSNGELKGNTLTITLPSPYALDWVEARLKSTIKRAAARIIGRPIELQLTTEYPQATGKGQPGPVPDPGPSPPGFRDGLKELNDPNIPPGCKIGVEIINFDPTIRGWIGDISNYAVQYWQPYLATRERQAGARSGGIAFPLWITLRSFPASWGNAKYWPSIQLLADICANHNRHVILGRAERGKGKNIRKRTVGALEILENERVVWPKCYGDGRDTIYVFRVLRILPLLTPTQISLLTPRLQERHTQELAKCHLDHEEWQQLTLPSLTQEKQ